MTPRRARSVAGVVRVAVDGPVAGAVDGVVDESARRPYAESSTARVGYLQSRFEQASAMQHASFPVELWAVFLGEFEGAVEGVERTVGRAVHLRDRPIRLRGGGR